MTVEQLDVLILACMFVVIFAGLSIILHYIKAKLVSAYGLVQRKRVYRHARKHGVRVYNKHNRLTK